MKRSSQSKLTKTLVSLSLDAPQVIAARTMRFYHPGSLLSASGQAEFTRMFTEKQAAATESYLSLVMSAATMSQHIFFGFMATFASGKVSLVSTTAAANSVNDALKPYQRRASANARRLGKRSKSR